MAARYERYFSEEQFAKIEASKIPDLLRKIEELKVDCLSPQHAFDVHIREKSELMVYHGGTCLLKINFSKVKGDPSDMVLFKSPSYGKGRGYDHEFSLFGGKRKLNEIDQMIPYICDFLTKVVKSVHPKFYRKEGYWSGRLSIDHGRAWQHGSQWMIFDREAVLGFCNETEKTSFYNNNLKFQEIKRKLQIEDPKMWGSFGKGETSACDFGDELDFLAIGPDKQLLCIELKHSSYTSGIYWGPLQASVYRDAYAREIDHISYGIKKHIQQKVRLGLLPPEAIQLLPEGNFCRVEGILAIADADMKLKSTCWEKAIKVNSQLPNPVKMVRAHSVDNHLKWVNSDSW